MSGFTSALAAPRAAWKSGFHGLNTWLWGGSETREGTETFRTFALKGPLQMDPTKTESVAEGVAAGWSLLVITSVKNAVTHDRCPCGSWHGTVASSVTRRIFVWSHVVPAFKYPGRTLKGRSKHQTVLNI